MLAKDRSQNIGHMISIWKLLGNTAGFAAKLFSAGSSKLSCQSRYRSIYVSDYMSKLYHQWIGLRENLNRKPENVPITYGAFRFQFSLKINPLISAYISYHHMLRQLEILWEQNIESHLRYTRAGSIWDLL